MSTILSTIADYARIRVQADREKLPLEALKEMCASKGRSDGVCFENALRKEGMSFICEIKKASPSKGIIAEEFPYEDIALEYQAAGADCISCLTEPKWFLGSDEIFTKCRSLVDTPMIRKDFTVDMYQIYQAHLMGADCVLLICALLDTDFISKALELCDTLGLSALVETHDEREIASAVSAGARIIGVNNRNLKDFSVDFSNAEKLRNLIPASAVYVAESGVRSADDIRILKRIGADAVLIGETFMRSDDKAGMLKSFREA